MWGGKNNKKGISRQFKYLQATVLIGDGLKQETEMYAVVLLYPKELKMAQIVTLSTQKPFF